MHRRRHNRHAPPNAMLNHFWQEIPSFQGETKPKPITNYDPNVFHPAAICRGPNADTIDLGLVDEFKTVSAFASKPVKVTMTGPHLLAAVAYDEYYNMLRRNTVLEINIREQATRPLVQTPHPSLPRCQEQRNHIRSPLSADFFSGLLESNK
jgi:hypothetical protein